jgi:ComF family protein
MLRDLLGLLYPRTCCSCDKALIRSENYICTYCRYHLPRTNYHLHAENPIHKLFWGRVPVDAAAAYLFFKKGGRVQHLLHSLKYGGMKELGELLGQLYGKELKASPEFSSIDCIVPVPLHPSKEKRRGFNQSQVFSEGLSNSMEKPLVLQNLNRTTQTSTQTRKARFARWQNVKEVFAVQDPSAFENKKVLLVDDVVTTGATLEACTRALRSSSGCGVSIATIAAAL